MNDKILEYLSPFWTKVIKNSPLVRGIDRWHSALLVLTHLRNDSMEALPSIVSCDPDPRFDYVPLVMHRDEVVSWTEVPVAGGGFLAGPQKGRKGLPIQGTLLLSGTAAGVSFEDSQEEFDTTDIELLDNGDPILYNGDPILVGTFLAWARLPEEIDPGWAWKLPPFIGSDQGNLILDNPWNPTDTMVPGEDYFVWEVEGGDRYLIFRKDPVEDAEKVVLWGSGFAMNTEWIYQHHIYPHTDPIKDSPRAKQVGTSLRQMITGLPTVSTLTLALNSLAGTPLSTAETERVVRISEGEVETTESLYVLPVGAEASVRLFLGKTISRGTPLTDAIRVEVSTHVPSWWAARGGLSFTSFMSSNKTERGPLNLLRDFVGVHSVLTRFGRSTILPVAGPGAKGYQEYLRQQGNALSDPLWESFGFEKDPAWEAGGVYTAPHFFLSPAGLAGEVTKGATLWVHVDYEKVPHKKDLMAGIALLTDVIPAGVILRAEVDLQASEHYPVGDSVTDQAPLEFSPVDGMEVWGGRIREDHQFTQTPC